MIKRLVILQDEQLVFSEIERNMRACDGARQARLSRRRQRRHRRRSRPPAAEQLENEGAGPDSVPDGDGRRSAKPVAADEASQLARSGGAGPRR